MAEVTPGPWKVEVQHEDEADGPALEVYVCSPATVCDATVVATMGKTRWIDPATTLSNAHLIAAAPDLYEALDALWRQAAQSPDLIKTQWGQEALTAAVAALSRARGEQS